MKKLKILLFAITTVVLTFNQGIIAGRVVFHNNKETKVKVMYIRERKAGDQEKTFFVKSGATQSITHTNKPIKNLRIFDNDDKEIDLPTKHQNIKKDAVHRFILGDNRNTFIIENKGSTTGPGCFCSWNGSDWHRHPKESAGNSASACEVDGKQYYKKLPSCMFKPE